MSRTPKTFESSFASHPRAAQWSSKNKKQPHEVFKSSNIKWLFDCDVCNHGFEMKLNNVVNGKWCGFCSGRNICGETTCKPCYNKSFATHAYAAQWSNLNGDIQPINCLLQSHTKYLFNCEKCPHVYDASLANIYKGKRCPYCSIPAKKLCNDNGCKQCFKKSFAASKRAAHWSIDNKDKDGNSITPRDVFISAADKYIFDCGECGHEFSATLNHVTAEKQPTWCPYCAVPSKSVCEVEDCDLCYKRSFASHPNAEFWDYKKNEKTPRRILKFDNRKYWFNCKEGHSFDMMIDHITNQHQWCPRCVNKTERKLYEFLAELYPTIKTEQKYDWCRNSKGNYLPFDFALEELKIIIELDGFQHFEDVNHWNSIAVEVQNNDTFKMQCALNKGYRVIRIYQPDVLSNDIDWESVLIDSINNTGSTYYLAENPDIYDSLIEQLDNTTI